MSKQRMHTYMAIVFLCVAVAGSAGFGMNRLLTNARARATRYSPSPVTPRIGFLGDAVPGALLVRDFDVANEEVYLLDVAAARVFVMSERAGHWAVARSFGRHGAAPGELLHPTGIAVSGNRVIVADADRLHVFDKRGKYIATRAPSFPCRLLDPHIYDGGPGLFVTGRCMRADTMSAELVYVDGDSVTSIAHDAMYTNDGSVGSALGADNLYSTGDGGGLFGAGTGNCAYRITNAIVKHALPLSQRECGLSRDRYAFIASAEYKARARALSVSRPFAAGILAPPEFLPTYIDRLAGRNDFILRPFSNDSFAFRPLGRDNDVLIAEANGLIGCRAAGCVWMRQDRTPLMMFVPTSAIDGAVVMRR